MTSSRVPFAVRRSRLIAWIIGFAACGATLWASAPARADAVLSPERAIVTLNAWRARVGVPPVAHDPTLSSNCQAHSAYFKLNPKSTGHFEDPSLPGYSAAGNTGAAQSNLSYGLGVGKLGALEWEQAVYHRAGLLHPRLASSGFWAEHGIACMAAVDRSGPPISELRTYPYPHDGQVDVPVEFGCNETPNPCDAFPGVSSIGYMPSLQFDGPWSSFGVLSFEQMQASIQADGAGTVPSIVDPRSGRGDALILLPKHRLATNTWHTVTVSGAVVGYVGGSPCEAIIYDDWDERVCIGGSIGVPERFPFSVQWRFKTVAAPLGPLRLLKPAIAPRGLIAVVAQGSGPLPSALTWIFPNGRTVQQSSGPKTRRWTVKPTVRGVYRACYVEGLDQRCVSFTYKPEQRVSLRVSRGVAIIRFGKPGGKARNATLYMHDDRRDGRKPAKRRVRMLGSVRIPIRPNTTRLVLTAKADARWAQSAVQRWVGRRYW